MENTGETEPKKELTTNEKTQESCFQVYLVSVYHCLLSMSGSGRIEFFRNLALAK